MVLCSSFSVNLTPLSSLSFSVSLSFSYYDLQETWGLVLAHILPKLSTLAVVI